MWRTTTQLAVGQVISWGLLYYVFAAALPFMEVELTWSSARLSMGFSMALLISGLVAPAMGQWTDKHATAKPMSWGILLGAGGLVLWGQSTTFLAYLIAWAAIGLAMAACRYDMAFATAVKTLPQSSRQSIITITLAGALASTLFLPLCTWVFRQMGWRMGLLVLAAALVITVLPLNLSLPKKPLEAPKSAPKTPQGQWERHAGDASRTFWVLGLAFSIFALAAA